VDDTCTNRPGARPAPGGALVHSARIDIPRPISFEGDGKSNPELRRHFRGRQAAARGRPAVVTGNRFNFPTMRSMNTFIGVLLGANPIEGSRPIVLFPRARMRAKALLFGERVKKLNSRRTDCPAVLSLRELRERPQRARLPHREARLAMSCVRSSRVSGRARTDLVQPALRPARIASSLRASG